MLYHLWAIDFAASFNSKKRRLDIGAAGREPHFVSAGAGANRPHIGRLSQRGLSHTDCAAPPLETQGGMMRIAITGASGFVGGHLARQLASEGHELFLLARGVDRRDPSAIHLPRAHFVQVGLSDPAALAQAFAGFTSYLVSNAIVLPLSGWISSIIGRK